MQALLMSKIHTCTTTSYYLPYTKWLCFRNFEMLLFHKLDHKSNEKIVLLIPLMLIGFMKLLRLLSCLNWRIEWGGIWKCT